MTTVELLTYARSRVKRAWTQGTSINSSGAVCASGAIFSTAPRASTPSHKTRNIAISYLERALDIVSPGATHISVWNDSVVRTKGEILALYDTAIKNAKRRHVLGD